jgi:hypothetical protein
MTFRFIPASDITETLPISGGISGASGSGKTYSALLMARGIVQEITGEKQSPFGLIDTENKRGLHYRRNFPEMQHLDFTALDNAGYVAGFTIPRWIEVIDVAEKANLPAVVMDSFSHSWAGVGGVLEMQALVLDRMVQEAEKRSNGRYTVERDKFSQLAWAEVKPQYRRLIDRIIRAKTNFIICTRAKPVMQKGFGDKAKNAFKTKSRRDDVPWNPETDGDLMFELAFQVILDPSAPGCPVHQIKVADEFKGILDPRKPITEETGRLMARWAKGNDETQREKRAMDTARVHARQGTEKFTAWWQSDEGKGLREMIRPIVPELRDLAQQADHASAVSDEDPFERNATVSEETPE